MEMAELVFNSTAVDTGDAGAERTQSLLQSLVARNQLVVDRCGTRPHQIAPLCRKVPIRHAELVRVMLAIIDQSLFGAIEPAEARGCDRQPLVVHPSSRKRQRIGEQRAPQRHRGAGRKAAAQQHLETFSSMDAAQFLARYLQYVEQRRTQRATRRIRASSITAHREQFRTALELLDERCQLFAMPEVVLVA